jgi:hypothetical protein
MDSIISRQDIAEERRSEEGQDQGATARKPLQEKQMGTSDYN